MRSAGNFHPEWGYLAPAPSFMRTLRTVLLATAIGATAGGAVVVALVGHAGNDDGGDGSIAAHALVTNVPPLNPPAAATASPAPAFASGAATTPASSPPVPKPATPLQQYSPDPAMLARAPAELSSAAPVSVAPAAVPEEPKPAAALPPGATPAVAEPVEEPSADNKSSESAERADKKPGRKGRRNFAGEPGRHYARPDSEARKQWARNRGFEPLFRLFGSSFN